MPVYVDVAHTYVGIHDGESKK